MLIALAAAAFVAGIAGAWSPCGFSMVDTLAATGFAQRMRTTALSCATFALGALVGGVATFGGLALLGATLGGGGGAAVAIAAALLLPAVAYVTRIRRTDKGTTTVILSLPRRT